MKKVWVVTGSEDGLLGVYTTKKRAYDRIKSYESSTGGMTVANNGKYLMQGDNIDRSWAKAEYILVNN